MKYCLFVASLFLFACQPSSGSEPDAAPSLLSEEELRSATNDGNLEVPDQPSFLLPFSISDSLTLLPESEKSPKAIYTISSYEAAFDNEKLNVVINTALGRIIVGEDAPMRVSDLRQTVQAFVKARIKTYHQQEIDSTLLESMPSAYGIDHRFKSDIRHHTDNILTISTNHYYYTGGAHGNYYSVLQSFDLETAQLIEFRDIFLPGNGAKLTELLKKYSAFQSDDIQPTKNIGLTQEGILFIYPPYEIGSYAEGEIEIALPYEVTRDYLTERVLSLINHR